MIRWFMTALGVGSSKIFAAVKHGGATKSDGEGVSVVRLPPPPIPFARHRLSRRLEGTFGANFITHTLHCHVRIEGNALMLGPAERPFIRGESRGTLDL